MSLDTVYVRLRTIQQIPFWKFAFFTGLLPAMISVLVISFLFNANAISPLQVPILELVLLSAFTIMFLASATIGIVFVIALSVILIKIRDQFYKSNGVMIGNSLSTNHDFLRRFAKGLFPHLIGLFKSYNDPRFEESEARHQREKDELKLEIGKVKEEAKQGIDEVKKEFMPEFQKARKEYQDEKALRIKAENERDKTSLMLNEVLSENFKLKEENKKLKGE